MKLQTHNSNAEGTGLKTNSKTTCFFKQKHILRYIQTTFRLGTTTALLGMLLLFTHCETLTDQEPNQVTDATPKATDLMASTTHTITTMDGTVTQVECSQETLPSGEIIQICIPAQWNGELIMYAHGYVPEFEPLSLPDQADVYKNIFTSVGFAFATTSYAQNGLAIQSGIADMLNLRTLYIQQFGEPKEIYLTGLHREALLRHLPSNDTHI
ncbi:hypothetical protein [Pontibacter pamirensis]|uniref:hypothetical protein n=1 Tax=Pontibacter pamirensis TaxID=2562824 RepID=UPI00138A5305|nr:hypothetical protein [Pontibacter pamirensis]